MKDLLTAFRTGHHEFQNGSLEGIPGIDPYKMFEDWMQDAVNKGEKEPNAFLLSTSGSDGQPSGRIVYLKDVEDDQFVFYTNYSSSKGKDIEENNKVCMSFFWPELMRQVRIEGLCTKVDPKISDAYFDSRPRGSKVGAWASHQSETLEDRKELEARVVEYDQKFKGQVPRPEHWGGYQIKPTLIEFWQGRPSRLHDRVEFTLNNGEWDWRLLNP